MSTLTSLVPIFVNTTEVYTHSMANLSQEAELDTETNTVDTPIGTEADRATDAACKMLSQGVRSRANRFSQIKKNEDMHLGVTGAALRGRNNVPFDCIVMGGFIDTLGANKDEEVVLKFGPSREQDKPSADKITAAWDKETGTTKGDIQNKVLGMDMLAALSGRGFMKMFLESAPKFATDLETIDHWDMITEAKGGSDLNKHLYKFQMNIFRSKADLLLGIEGGWYDKLQVRKLVLNYETQGDLFQKAAETLGEKASRWQAFGIDSTLDSYVGTKMYRLTEGIILFEGKWKYILFSYETKTWVRFEDLAKVFPHAADFPGMGAWVSYATNPHPFIFWSKAPADDIRPIGYTMKKIVNLTLDNLEKRNWDMTAYDPKMFTEPSKLYYRQEGLVQARRKNGESIESGIFKFQTPDTTAITINLTQWLDNFVGQKTGITSDAQGASGQDKVGIYYGNIQQLSKRMMLANKMKRQLFVNLGIIFDYGCYAFMREPYAVKLIGIEGARWEEEITKNDTEKEFTISITSGSETLEQNAPLNIEREKTFARLDSNPLLLSKVNTSWYIRENLKKAGYNDEQVRVALDVQDDGSDMVMARAAQAIQDCLEGQEYLQLYRGATTGFVQKIVDFANDKFPLVPDVDIARLKPSQQLKYKKDMVKFDRLIKYAADHVPIAQANMKRKLVSMISSGALGAPTGAPNGDQSPAQNGQEQTPPPFVQGQPQGPTPQLAR